MMRYAITVVLLALTAAYVWLHPPEDLAVAHGVLQSVPAAFGPWQGSSYKFDDAVVDELKADDIVIRRYQRGDDKVWLCVVYHQNRRYGAHDPLLCYQSQGFAIAREGHAEIADGTPQGVPVRTFVAERGKQVRVVWYWWTTQGLSTRDAAEFRRAMALRGVLDNRSWGAFVRIESVVRDGDLEGASARAAEFAGRVAREMPKVFAAGRTPALPAP